MKKKKENHNKDLDKISELMWKNNICGVIAKVESDKVGKALYIVNFKFYESTTKKN